MSANVTAWKYGDGSFVLDAAPAALAAVAGQAAGVIGANPAIAGRTRSERVGVPSAVLKRGAGANGQDLVRISGEDVQVASHVEDVAATTRDRRVAPLPATQAGKPDQTWFLLQTLAFPNNIPTPQSVEIFFTRNIPAEATDMTWRWRPRENDAIGASREVVIPGVGGAANVSRTADYSEPNGFRWRISFDYLAASRSIKVSAVPRDEGAHSTLVNVQTQLVYVVEDAVPAVPAHDTWATIGHLVDGQMDFIFALYKIGNERRLRHCINGAIDEHVFDDETWAAADDGDALTVDLSNDFVTSGFVQHITDNPAVDAPAFDLAGAVRQVVGTRNVTDDWFGLRSPDNREEVEIKLKAGAVKRVAADGTETDLGAGGGGAAGSYTELAPVSGANSNTQVFDVPAGVGRIIAYVEVERPGVSNSIFALSIPLVGGAAPAAATANANGAERNYSTDTHNITQADHRQVVVAARWLAASLGGGFRLRVPGIADVNESLLSVGY